MQGGVTVTWGRDVLGSMTVGTAAELGGEITDCHTEGKDMTEKHHGEIYRGAHEINMQRWSCEHEMHLVSTSASSSSSSSA